MNNTTIGVFSTHEKAIEAVLELQNADFPIQQVSLIGKAEIINDHMHLTHNRWIQDGPVSVGAIIGPILGILTGVGIFAIPGFGFIFGAGAVVGAFAGFDIGLVGGGVISLLATLGVKKEVAIKYHKHLEEKRFLVIARGNPEETKKAKSILRKLEEKELHVH